MSGAFTTHIQSPRVVSVSAQSDATWTERKLLGQMLEFPVGIQGGQKRAHPIQLSGVMLLCVWDTFMVLGHCALKVTHVLLSRCLIHCPTGGGMME